MSTQRISSLGAAILVLLGLSLAAGLASGSAATTASARAAAASFTDPAGDARGAGPDITSIALSDTASTGVITVTLNVAGYSAAFADDSTRIVNVYLDTDKNVATGAPDQGGVEYCLGAARDGGGSGWWIERWDGTRYVEIPQSPGMHFTGSADSLTWTFNKTDIGGATGFAFSTWASTWDATDVQTGEDDGPDTGTWVYDLSAPPPPTPVPAPKTPQGLILKPVLSAPTVVPAKPIAGKTFTVVFHVTRNDTGAALTTGTMICDPSVNGKVLPHTELFKGGTAKLAFLVPKTMKGKQLAVKLTIKVGTQSTTKVVTYRIG